MTTIAVHLDESGTHKGSPWCVVAGYLGAAADWGQFTDDWNAVRNRPEYGGVLCHASDLWSGHGTFECWSRLKRFQFAMQLTRVIENWKGRIYGFAVAIPVPDFYVTIAPNLYERVREPYFAGLLAILSRVLTMSDRKFGPSMVTCFADQKKEYEYRGRELYKIVRRQLGVPGNRLDEELNYRSSKLVVPLQAADFLANSAFRDLSVGESGDLATDLIRGEINIRLNRCFAERPVRLEAMELRAIASGDFAEMESRAGEK